MHQGGNYQDFLKWGRGGGVFRSFSYNNLMNLVFFPKNLQFDPLPTIRYKRVKFYVACFYCMPSWGLSQYIANHLLLPHVKLFEKTKRDLELVSLPHFLNDFWRKIVQLLCSITWLRFIVWLLLLHEILGNMCIVIIC